MNNQQLASQLEDVNEALGEIYTKGNDSVLLVKCRQFLYGIIEKIREQNEDKKE